MADITGIDLDGVAGVLAAAGVIGEGAGLRAELISGGRSNLTYRIEADRFSAVLRRPPLGHVLATAHDVGREYRVLAALADTAVPVPRPVILWEDSAAIGAPFYVMEFVGGDVLRTRSDVDTAGPACGEKLAFDLIDVLARLHSVDPARVGLGDFGRPAGFMSRQMRRWVMQLDGSRSREIPGIDELAERLAAGVPRQRRTALVHGDYRLDNCVVRGPRVAAVLDWEMSTLGDPMSDIGMFVLYYEGLAGVPNDVVYSPAGSGGFPGVAALLDVYSRRTGDPLDDLDWYTAFASFKFAVILEGIHYRHVAGLTLGPGFGEVSGLVPAAVDLGLQALARSSR